MHAFGKNHGKHDVDTQGETNHSIVTSPIQLFHFIIILIHQLPNLFTNPPNNPAKPTDYQCVLLSIIHAPNFDCTVQFALSIPPFDCECCGDPWTIRRYSHNCLISVIISERSLLGRDTKFPCSLRWLFFYSCTVKLNPDVGLQDHYWTYYYYCKDILQGNGYMGCKHAHN